MKETLRDLFRQKFNYSEYRKVILQNLLHAQELMREPEFLEETNDGDRIYGLGYLRDADGKEIGLYYTNVTKGDVRHKRVGFRKMMKKYTDFGVDAAITVFADKEHWRLSYMCDLKGGVTAAKRFSYIMGDGGMYVTPVNRLSELAGKRIKLEDIHDAFSVEALSDEFFKAYHDHYDIIVAALARLGKTGAVYHDYVKKMMGRIVFLHFLQKKGWLNGNPTFLRDLFFFSPHKDDFLDQVLEPLFFGIFNTEKGQREKLFASEHWDKNLLKEWESMPYLNGGLFERDEIDKMAIKLPASLFDDLFSFLASYNFTVDENDPDDAEIGVDPEMLGKIFESLLEDNKAKGAFYTPKEIVRYMCKESLIAHLASKLPDVSEIVIRTFVETHEMQQELEPYRDTLGNALRDVKICDPAIGSGAFPMGLLNELWRCREALGTDMSRLQLKKEIIENNIYGVDIERGAIDIARLRFWLSIVVDSDKAEPLPNFDYKFMQGNSLIESYGGFDLSRIAGKSVGRPSTATQLVLGLDSDLSRKNLQRLLRDYFSVTDHLKKATMRQAINDEVKRLILNSIGGTPAFLKNLSALDPSANQEFFLWHTWFKDIFDKGGFDIVIANPPYIKEYENSSAFELLKVGKYYKAKMDIWFYFACNAIDILKEGGVLSFIAQPQWRTSDAASILRNKICDECRLIHIIDFGTYMVFENASTQAMVMTLFKSSNSIYEFNFKINDGIIHNSMELERFLTSPFAIVEFDKRVFKNSSFAFSTDSGVSKVLTKIRNKANFTIDKNKEIIQGIIGSPDEAFKLKSSALYSFSESEQFYIKPFHTTTYRYHTPQENLYLLYLSDKNIHLTKEGYPAIYNKLLPYKQELDNRREVINGRKSWFSLWWERDESFFLPGAKIIFAARTLGRNFTYTDEAFYASRNCFFIKSSRINLKYLTGLLNSTMMYYYMHQTIKHNGDLLQLDKVQFLSIPLYKPTAEIQNEIARIVDQILCAKCKHQNLDTSALEQEIDRLVYKLYNLTDEEIAVIERDN